MVIIPVRDTAVVLIYTDFPDEDLICMLVRNSISREIKYVAKEPLGLFQLILVIRS